MSDHSGGNDIGPAGQPARGQQGAVRLATRLGRRLERSLRIGVRAAGRGVVEFYRSENLTFAASIAYYSLLSIFPFSLLVLAVLGHITVGSVGPRSCRC